MAEQGKRKRVDVSLRQFAGFCALASSGRELPDRFGKWNSVLKRVARWEENSIWADIFKHFVQDASKTAVRPDSATVRAHMCAAGGSKWEAVSKVSARCGARGGSSEVR